MVQTAASEVIFMQTNAPLLFPAGLTPLPIPLSPALRQASSPTSTSSSTSFNKPVR